MAGLGPAIHETPLVGPRAKPGEDEMGCSSLDGFGSGDGVSDGSASDQLPPPRLSPVLREFLAPLVARLNQAESH